MADKKIRPSRDVQIEMCEVAQKIGFLTYQMEEEIPKEIGKLMCQMHNLQLEGDKILKAEDQAAKILKENGIAVDLPQSTTTETEPPKTEPTVN